MNRNTNRIVREAIKIAQYDEIDRDAAIEAVSEVIAKADAGEPLATDVPPSTLRTAREILRASLAETTYETEETL